MNSEIKKNKIWYLTLSAWLFWMVPVLGAETPTHFSADTMQCHKQSKDYVCTYRGNAKFEQGNNKLTAPKITTYQDMKHEIYQVIAEGEPARYHSENEKKKVVDANAKIIKFYPPRNFITFTHEAQIVENNTTFAGEYLEQDLTKKTIVSRPNDKVQTTILIPPQS